jgi:hypothetical protein
VETAAGDLCAAHGSADKKISDDATAHSKRGKDILCNQLQRCSEAILEAHLLNAGVRAARQPAGTGAGGGGLF